MALPPNMKPKQDMPPAGGYKAFSPRRIFGKNRVSSIPFLAIVGIVTVYSNMKLSQYRSSKLDIRAQKLERRSFIFPFVQAEKDLRYLCAHQKQLEIEEYLMRDNPEWEVGKSMYNTDFNVMYHPKDPKIRSIFIWDE